MEQVSAPESAVFIPAPFKKMMDRHALDESTLGVRAQLKFLW